MKDSKMMIEMDYITNVIMSCETKLQLRSCYNMVETFRSRYNDVIYHPFVKLLFTTMNLQDELVNKTK